jgi:hypothetical protein
MEYMAYLEKRLKHQVSQLCSFWDAQNCQGSTDFWLFKQSNKIVLATVGTDKVNFSPLTDFKIDFEDRQELKIIEDYVLDLEVILPGMLDSITGVRDQCRSNLTSYDHEDDQRSEMEAIIEELDEYIGEVRVHIGRAKNLKDKANSTAQLVRQNSLVRRL